MRIFGRKANQQSPFVAAPDVPPELQPYYGRPSLGTRLRRVGLFVLPVVAALALIAALIAGGVWLKHRSEENSHKVATSQSTTQKPATSGKNNSSTQNENGSQGQPSGSSSDNSASSSNSTSGSSSQQSTGSTTNNQNSSSNIPSTGPDAGMYLVALAMALAGTAAAYARQLKMLRR